MEYKGEIKGFPQEIVEKMLDYQEKQGNKRNIEIAVYFFAKQTRFSAYYPDGKTCR